MAVETKVAKKSDIPPGSSKVVEVGGKAVALFNCNGTFHAMDNECKHRGGPLGEGSLSGTIVTCPWHGWEYDVTSGTCQFDSSIKVQKFEVRVDGDDIVVSV
jgi:nitrite reductase/ring-hydroxylating ferredoxin subunit